MRLSPILIAMTMLLVAFGPFSSTQPSWAQSPVFEYRPSQLGIDYYALAPSPMAELLSQGEGEWLENAWSGYEEDTRDAWKEELVPQIVTGAVSKATIRDLEDFTPKMLRKFAVGLDPKNKKYRYLFAIGSRFLSGQVSAK